MTEPTLFTPPPATGGLTDRQQLVLTMLEREPAGLTSADVGVELHQALDKPCVCGRGGGCKWSVADALSVLRALKKRGLVRQRKAGVWQPTGAPDRSAARPDSRPDAYDPTTAPIPY